MGEAKRTIHIVTTDEVLLASARAAAAPIEGWELSEVEDATALLTSLPAAGDVILLDAGRQRGDNVYEACRRLTGRTRCRTFVVTGTDVDVAEPIACFCGATAVLGGRSARRSCGACSRRRHRPRALPADARREEPDGRQLPESLLRDLVAGEVRRTSWTALTDPETSLFNYEFLNYKLDEEFKRAQRFGQPLSCVMLGFEGQARDEVLRELAGDLPRRLARHRRARPLRRELVPVLPAEHRARTAPRSWRERVREQAEERGLRDLVGDPLEISVGISSLSRTPRCAVARISSRAHARPSCRRPPASRAPGRDRCSEIPGLRSRRDGPPAPGLVGPPGPGRTVARSAPAQPAGGEQRAMEGASETGARREAGGGPRLALTVDELGSYLLVPGDDLVLGHLRGEAADLPFLADVGPRHARLSRSTSFRGGARWSIVPLEGEPVAVNGRPVSEGGQPLAHGDRVTLGVNLGFRFHRPDAASTTAVLRAPRGHRVPRRQRSRALRRGARGSPRDRRRGPLPPGPGPPRGAGGRPARGARRGPPAPRRPGVRPPERAGDGPRAVPGGGTGDGVGARGRPRSGAGRVRRDPPATPPAARRRRRPVRSGTAPVHPRLPARRRALHGRFSRDRLGVAVPSDDVVDWELFYNRFRTPDFIPGYEIQNRLGGGAFGEVYKARKHSIGKAYAIKFLQARGRTGRAASSASSSRCATSPPSTTRTS